MSLETVLIIWAIGSLIVLLCLGASVFMSREIGGIDPSLGRGTRILLVALGPLTIIGLILWIIPPTRLLLYSLYNVLIKK